MASPHRDRWHRFRQGRGRWSGCRWGVVCAAVLFHLASTHDVNAACGPETLDRPRVGVALSGGGARGVTHVGVLRALAARGVPIDCMAGTSIGAVVGGLYASGMALETIEALLVDRDWDALFEDRTAFRELGFRRKQNQRRYRLGVRLGLGKGGIRLPAGLSAGQQLGTVLQANLLDAADDFDRLPIPFRAVATDIVTGERVVLDAGSLARAVQASATLPGIMAPLEIDGRLLVDGGLVANLPVDVVRAMGADLVIAVDISEPLFAREELDSLVAITWQMVGIQTRGNMTAQLAAADIVLVPDLDGFSSSSFARVAEMVARGDAAVVAADAQLRPLVLDPLEPTAGSSDGVDPPHPALAPTIADVRFEGLRRIDARRLAGRVHSQVGTPLDAAHVQADAASLFALDRFDRVGVHTVASRAGDQVDVIFNVVESRQHVRLLADLQLRADLEGETDVQALASIIRTELNARGGEWRSDLWVGASQGLFSELYQPVDFRGRLALVPSVAVTSTRQDVFDDAGKQAEYEVDARTVTVDLVRQWGRYGEVRLGWLRGHIDARDAVGSSGLARRDDAVGAARLAWRVDTTDDRTFPRHGFALDAGLTVSRRGLGADAPYRRAHVASTYFAAVGGGHSVFVGVAGGRRYGDDALPASEQFRLGGLLSLGGYPLDRFRGDAMAVGRLGYVRHLGRLPTGLGGRVVGGAVAEWGATWRRPAEATTGDLQLSLTAFLGADTVLGPVMFGYGRAEDGSDRFYVSLGQGLR